MPGIEDNSNKSTIVTKRDLFRYLCYVRNLRTNV